MFLPLEEAVDVKQDDAEEDGEEDAAEDVVEEGVKLKDEEVTGEGNEAAAAAAETGLKKGSWDAYRKAADE